MSLTSAAPLAIAVLAYRGVAQFSNTPSAVRLGKNKQFHTVNLLYWRPPKCLNPTPNSLTSHWPTSNLGGSS